MTVFNPFQGQSRKMSKVYLKDNKDKKAFILLQMQTSKHQKFAESDNGEEKKMLSAASLKVSSLSLQQ